MFSNIMQFPGALPAGGTTLTSGTQAAYMESEPAAPPPAPQGRIIRGFIVATGGSTGGTWVIKCYQGAGLSGTQVGGSQSFTMAASSTYTIPFGFTDATSTAPSTGVYTIGVTAAGSNGTAVDGQLEIFVSDPTGAED